jgi:hypothetical protein
MVLLFRLSFKSLPDNRWVYKKLAGIPGANFWSSTENYNSQSFAWNVNLNNGNTNNNTKATANNVRCVRREAILCPGSVFVYL